MTRKNRTRNITRSNHEPNVSEQIIMMCLERMCPSELGCQSKSANRGFKTVCDRLS